MMEIYAAGAMAAFTVDVLIYPLDTIKTRYQSQDYLQTFASTASKKTPVYRGLYQGIGSVVLATLPAAGIFFSTYESTKSLFSRTLPIPDALVYSSASAIAELASCLVLAPAEVIKQNAQMLKSNKNTPGASSSTSLRAFRQLGGTGAFRRLFTGYTALVARNLPFTALQFPIFEHIRGRIWKSRSEGREDAPRGLVETGVITGGSAGSAGAFAAFITTPSDVVKTRMMLSAGSKDEVKAKIAGKQAKKGAWTVTQEVYRERGVKGFFRVSFPFTAILDLVSRAAMAAIDIQTAPGAGVPVFTKDDTHVEITELGQEFLTDGRHLIQSPYSEKEHQLDLETLDHENALLARGLTKLQALREDYATASYLESFNWPQVIEEVKRLAEQSGKPFKETSFYIVAFRSQIKPSTEYAHLGRLDKAAHAEAVASGGFLKYWFGAPDPELRNLATCIWRTRQDAKDGGTGPAHRRAAGATRSLYAFWQIDQHRLIIRDNAESWEIIPWSD
ncbi:hypothetical protein G7046_g66 [Stylonectria norvegica]|nr:hypothetical protein G7046_g66 [Stylonectria norvegica]